MKEFERYTFVCVDCETTGLDPKTDRVIEVALSTFNVNGLIASYETLIDPGCPIPAESSRIHHITDGMVVGQPQLHMVLPEILQLISSHIIVGHGINFDIELLALAAERYAIRHSLRTNVFLDTLRMARLYGRAPTNSLEQLRQHFCIAPEGAHRAMSDVTVNIGVFLNLLKDYKNMAHLQGLLEKPIQMAYMPLGKYKGRAIKDLPNEYLRWAAHQKFDRDLLYTLRSEIKRRKSGALFSQASNPFAALS